MLLFVEIKETQAKTKHVIKAECLALMFYKKDSGLSFHFLLVSVWVSSRHSGALFSHGSTLIGASKLPVVLKVNSVWVFCDALQCQLDIKQVSSLNIKNPNFWKTYTQVRQQLEPTVMNLLLLDGPVFPAQHFQYLPTTPLVSSVSCFGFYNESRL